MEYHSAHDQTCLLYTFVFITVALAAPSTPTAGAAVGAQQTESCCRADPGLPYFPLSATVSYAPSAFLRNIPPCYDLAGASDLTKVLTNAADMEE